VTRRLISSGSSFEREIGYSRAVVDGAWIRPCWPSRLVIPEGGILRKYFGDARPAATMISASLADPRMRIEIEVTARRPPFDHGSA
jgi:hypothetical protein